jgi:hypothetical protein
MDAVQTSVLICYLADCSRSGSACALTLARLLRCQMEPCLYADCRRYVGDLQTVLKSPLGHHAGRRRFVRSTGLQLMDLCKTTLHIARSSGCWLENRQPPAPSCKILHGKQAALSVPEHLYL